MVGGSAWTVSEGLAPLDSIPAATGLRLVPLKSFARSASSRHEVQRVEGATTAYIIDLKYNLPHGHPLTFSVVSHACGLLSDMHYTRMQFEGDN